MNQFIGTKLIAASPMTRADYNAYRYWELPANENGADTGFLVEYLDGGTANDARHKGYISWSPSEVFNNAYRPIKGLTFGMALEALKIGQKVARSGWNGKGMWLEYHQPMAAVDLPYIRMSYPVGSGPYPAGARVPWLASQTDMLVQDWGIVT